MNARKRREEVCWRRVVAKTSTDATVNLSAPVARRNGKEEEEEYKTKGEEGDRIG